jgi:hypothetical protein
LKFNNIFNFNKLLDDFLIFFKKNIFINSII